MWRIPLSELNTDDAETSAVKAVLESGWLTMGPRTEEFESRFAAMHGAKHAIAVTNCTCALDLSYRYIVRSSTIPQPRIIIPDITFVATANAAYSAGTTPLLADIDSPAAPFLSPHQTEQILSTRHDIAAVVIVHYAGIDSRSEQFAEICKRFNVPLIEDCAHSPGASTASGRSLGTIGLAGCFSFFSNKNMTTGEGGMIITNDDAMAHWLRKARSHGMTSGTWNRHTTARFGYDVKMAGFNYRCTEITAALGLVQLQKLADANAARRRLTSLYNQLLSGDSRFKVLTAPDLPGDQSACHILPLLCDSPSTRDAVRKSLTHESIQTSHHYAPIHTFSYYQQQNTSSSQFPNANSFAEREITLPLHPKLSPAHIEEICHRITSIQ